MKILRQADAWGVARANAMALQAQQQAKAQSQDAKQQRCEHNRKLAEALVASWSAAEYKQKFDAELQAALDGQAESFNPNQPKYQTRMPSVASARAMQPLQPSLRVTNANEKKQVL